MIGHICSFMVFIFAGVCVCVWSLCWHAITRNKTWKNGHFCGQYIIIIFCFSVFLDVII